MSKEPTRAEMNRRLRKLSRKEKLKLCQKMFTGPQEVRRNFVIFDTSNSSGFSPSKSVVLHLPSMLWHGFDFTFAEALEKLDDPHCNDQELIQIIYRIEH